MKRLPLNRKLKHIPNTYLEPLGLPLYWRNESTGLLAKAITAYLDNRLKGEPMSEFMLGLVHEYLIHYIHAPCWYRNPHLSTDSESVAILDGLVRDVTGLKTPDDIQAWIWRSMAIGLDPL